MKSKLIAFLQMFALFCIYLMVNLTVAHALTITHDPSADVTVTGDGAEIRWITDAEADSTVDYGTSSSLGSIQSGSSLETSHSITITGLGAAATYYYKLTSSGNGETATADNSGSLYSFTTPAASASADTAPPQFNVTVPQYYNRRQLTFGGYTEPDCILKLYLNANQADIGTDRYTQLTTSDGSGHFFFKYVNLGDENNLVIWAKDPAGNTNTATYKVMVDTEDPIVQIKDPPAIAASASIAINGTVSEDVTVTIAVNNDTKTQDVKAGSFNLPISLKDGIKNKIDIQFADRSGNVYEKEYVVGVDTQGPRVLWHNLASLDPSYIQEVFVQGNVSKPGATVIIFVNNKTYSSEAWSTSIRDMAVHYGTILTEGGSGEYATKADANGNFKIKIFLTQEIATTKSEYQRDVYQTSPTSTSSGYNPSNPSGALVNPPSGTPTTYGTSTSATGVLTSGATGRGANAWDNHIIIAVFDELGRSDKQTGIITFARCGYGADWNILVSAPTPSVTTPEHLRKGIAQIAFGVKFEWQGPSSSSNRSSHRLIRDPVIQQYKLSEDMRKNYVFNPNEIMGRVFPVWSTDRKRGYVVIDLQKQDYQQKNLSSMRKEDLLLKLPLQVELEYQYDDGTGNIVTGIQKQCWDVSTMLDVRIPPSVIPKELLNASVRFLNSTITAINKILKPLKAITIAVFVTCLLGWVMYFFALMRKAYDCKDSKPDKKSDACRESTENAKRVEKYMHLICDRIFCPSVPTADEYFQTAASADCKGKALTPEMSKDDKKCGQEYMDQWDSGCLLMNELERSKCIRYQAGDSRFQQSCAESGQLMKNMWYGASDFCRKKDNAEPTRFSVSRGNNEFQEWVVDENGKAHRVSQVTQQQMKRSESGSYVSTGAGASATTYDTVPIGEYSEGGKDYSSQVTYDDEGRLYVPDPSSKDGKQYLCFADDRQYKLIAMHRNDAGVLDDNECRTNKPASLPPEVMKAVDLPQARKEVVDPTDNLLTALQCVCLPAINGFLTMWRNMLGAIMQCFQAILITGDGSAGLCRDVLSQYICDIVFNAIRCFVNRYSVGVGSRENPASGISSFFKSAATAGNDIQQSISGRYGKSALYKTMFSERKLIHAVCLWAFTGDFDFDIGSALTGAGAIPLKSKAFLYPRTRRFIASNPLTGYTTHIYHIGAGLVAGADIGYRLQLVCTTGDTCDPKEGFPNGLCDCYKSGREDPRDITSSFGPGRLNAGEMLGPNEGDIYVRISDARYRYDEVRLTYWFISNEGNSTTVIEKGKISQIGGNPPADCSFDLAGGVFRCSYEIGDMGYAIFTDVPKPQKRMYGLGDKIYLDFKVDKRSPQRSSTGAPEETSGYVQDYDQIPFFMRYIITSPTGSELVNKVVLIGAEGVTDYSGKFPGIDVTEDTMMGNQVGKDYEVINEKAAGESYTVISSLSDYDTSNRDSSIENFAIFVQETTDKDAEKDKLQEAKKAGKDYDLEAHRTFEARACGVVVEEKELKGVIKEYFTVTKTCTPVVTEAKSDSGLSIEFQPYKSNLQIKYHGIRMDVRVGVMADKIMPVKPLKKGNNWGGIVMRYKPASTQSSIDCKTKFTTATPATYTVKIGLYPCRQKDESLPKSLSNCDADPTPVDYFGAIQEHEIGVTAVCSKSGETTAGICDPLNAKLSNECECREELTGKPNCATTGKGDYCFYAVTDYECIKYVSCKKNIFINDAAYATKIHKQDTDYYYCDCNGDSRMEDCSQRYCYDGKDGWKCYPNPPQ